MVVAPSLLGICSFFDYNLTRVSVFHTSLTFLTAVVSTPVTNGCAKNAGRRLSGTCMHTCIHTCIHTCMHTCIHTYTCTYTRTRTCTYIHTCTHTCTHMHTQALWSMYSYQHSLLTYTQTSPLDIHTNIPSSHIHTDIPSSHTHRHPPPTSRTVSFAVSLSNILSEYSISERDVCDVCVQYVCARVYGCVHECM